jgi:hypothetical protein
MIKYTQSEDPNLIDEEIIMNKLMERFIGFEDLIFDLCHLTDTLSIIGLFDSKFKIMVVIDWPSPM